MPLKKWNSASNTSQASTPSLKSLASKARSTIQKFKQKATEILSLKKNKKTKCIPQREHETVVTDTKNGDLYSPIAISSWEGSVIEVTDGDNADEELCE